MKRYFLLEGGGWQWHPDGDKVRYSDALAALESLRERAAKVCERNEHDCSHKLRCHEFDAVLINALPLLIDDAPSGAMEELQKLTGELIDDLKIIYRDEGWGDPEIVGRAEAFLKEHPRKEGVVE